MVYKLPTSIWPDVVKGTSQLTPVLAATILRYLYAKSEELMQEGKHTMLEGTHKGVPNSKGVRTRESQ